MMMICEQLLTMCEILFGGLVGFGSKGGCASKRVVVSDMVSPVLLTLGMILLRRERKMVSQMQEYRLKINTVQTPDSD